MNIKRTPEELIITWRMWLVIFLTAFGIFLGGVTSGVFYQIAKQSATQVKAVDDLGQKIDQLPAKTAEAVKEDDHK